jgi:hypothetical protein
MAFLVVSVLTHERKENSYHSIVRTAYGRIPISGIIDEVNRLASALFPGHSLHGRI